jgi:uncharacterized protein YqjF (DUF2071 family)
MAETTELDRVSPTIAPQATPALRQRWHHLLFLHWPVEPQKLRPLLPAGLDLDLFEGRAWVSLVPFTMSGVRPILVPPLPIVSSFHEINVRTYVHHGGRDPGVYFFSLDASSGLAVALGRTFFHLAYVEAEIRFELARETPPIVEVESRRTGEPGRGAGMRARWTPHDAPFQAEFRSLDFFVLERYLLFAADGDRVWRGQVHHPPYRIQAVTVEGLEENLLAAAGIERPDVPPLAHYSAGVDVDVFAAERVR